MTTAAIIIGFLEIFGALMAVLIFYLEQRRLPGTYCRWSPYTRASSGQRGILVGVCKKSNRLAIRTIRVDADDFDDRIAAAESEARARCIVLNATDRGLARRLPK